MTIKLSKRVKNLCSELTNASQCPPHATTFLCQLNDLKNTLHEKCLKTLKSEINNYQHSITFNHWKGENHSNYLVLTVHYIPEPDWVLQSRCLSVVSLENLNAVHIAAATEKIIQNHLEKYDIKLSHTFFATTDTADTMPWTSRRLDIQW